MIVFTDKIHRIGYDGHVPARNTIKQFVENGYYHLYNRGVEKRTIFEDVKDYRVFLSYLETYLIPKDTAKLDAILLSPVSSCREKNEARKLLRLNNFCDSIALISYCLMPNHFHFQVKQTDAMAIDRFMNSLATRYTMYFNLRHKRVGPLFQNVYKAVSVTGERQHMHLNKYIHRNPLGIVGRTHMSLERWPFSSYPDYLGLRKTPWLASGEMMQYFPRGPYTYREFIDAPEGDGVFGHDVFPISLDWGD